MASDVVSLLLFRFGAGLYGVPGAKVSQSIRASGDLAGEVPFEGRLFPLVDLRTLFRGAGSAAGERLVLLVEVRGERLALGVDDWLGEAEIHRRQDLPWTYRQAERRLISGVDVRPDGEIALLVRPAALLAATRGAIRRAGVGE